MQYNAEQAKEASTDIRPSWGCGVAWPLAVAAYDPNLLRDHWLCLVVHFESNVFDQEGPDFITETVGIEMSLEGELAWAKPTLPPPQ